MKTENWERTQAPRREGEREKYIKDKGYVSEGINEEIIVQNKDS